MGYDVVDSAAFIDKNGEIFSVNMYLRDLYINPSYQPLLNVIAGTSGINVWFPMQKRDILTDNSDAAVLTLGKKVNRIETGNELGTLFLNVKEDRFSSIFENIEKTENKIFLITDENGNIISASDKNLLFTPIDRVIGEWDGRKNPDFDIRNLSDGKRVLLTKISLNKGKWNLVSIIDMEILTKDIREISKIILWIIVICCIIAFGGDALLSNVIATPILKLTRVMARIHEDRYETIVQRHGNDEIGNLVAGFNKMTNKIKELITKIEEEKKQKREYELSLLQSQIKPHFLYNTLDVIYVLSDMGCSREAKTATKALADFYRASLSGGNEIITIRQEIEMVKNYLHIQHFRYKDIFDYKIDVDESIMKYCILKLTIQPLIENAIYHGVKNKPDLGHITIEGSEEKNCIIINVIDDGVGMSEQKLRSILDNAEKKGKSFGLACIHNRIRLFFGEKYGLEISSQEGQGTKVTVRIPRLEGEVD